MRTSHSALALLVRIAVLAPGVLSAQAVPDSGHRVDLHVDSGWVSNTCAVADVEGIPTVVYRRLVTVPGAAWLRLEYGGVALSGATDRGGDGSFLRITSLKDGHAQTQHSMHVAQWRNTSAYFNGDTVLVEILAVTGTGRNRIVIDGALAGDPMPESICGPTDDRVLSYDNRVGRNQPLGCTSWIIDDCNHCLLTAGHCTSGLQVVEFNVPLSTAGGSLQHPPPSDQYAVDPASLQGNGGQGYGDDWAYFGLFPNSNTGLTAWEAQGKIDFKLAPPPPVGGQSLRVTGYGSVSSPVPPTWYLAQKTHAGPYTSLFGTAVGHASDTTTGNSGSPVVDDATGAAIAIHTHAGCTVGGGENYGTGTHHPGLQAALANPQGVCTCPGPSYATFGQGCAGSAGVPTLRPQNLPALGTTFRLDMTNLPQGGGLAYMALGFSNTAWNGTALPINLGPYGLTGCTGYISVDRGELIQNVGGTATWSLTIPNDPALQGIRFFNQGVSLEAAGAAVSDAGDGTVF